jgi:hypothetical protein
MYAKMIEEAEKIATQVGNELTTDDTNPAFSLIYVPKWGSGGAAATVALVQGSSMTFLVDGAVPAGADVIGTSGVIDTGAAAYDTVGELANYVNGRKAWRMRCLCDPATKMATILAKVAATCLVDGGLTFYFDTNVADTTYIWNCPITGNCFFNPSPGGIFWGNEHAVVNKILSIQFSQNFSSAATMYVKQWKKGDTAGTTIWQKALTDRSSAAVAADSYGIADPDIPWLTGQEGYSLSVEIRSDAATSPAVFSVRGKTVVRDGAYVVNAKQY